MAHVVQLTPEIAVAGQLTPDDVDALARRGFKAIINNRPDGEAPDQPSAAAIAAAAARNGRAYRAVPVVSGRLGEADIAAFAQALGELERPLVAFCRSGTRSTTVWALASAPGADPDSLIRAAADAGYDLSGLRPALEARRGAKRG